MKFIIFTLIVSSFFLPVNAQVDVDSLSVTQIQEDINFYFQPIKKWHPEYASSLAQSQLDSIRVNTLKECCRPMSIMELTKALYKTNKYFDGHTGISWNKLYSL